MKRTLLAAMVAVLIGFIFVDLTYAAEGHKEPTLESPVAAPTLTPSGGSYSGTVSVTMQTATAGASIYFSTDGSTPTQSSRLYNGAVTLTSSAVIKAKAYKRSYRPSAEVSAAFTRRQPFNFTLSNSGNLSVQAGASATDTISATLSAGSNSRPVALSAAGLPAGATAAFATSSCSPNCSTVVTIRTAGATPAGSYPITVTARGGEVSRTTGFTLTVRAVPVPPPSAFDFSLTNGGPMTLAPTASGVTTITATRLNGTTQPIALSAAGFPSGVTSSFSQRTCAPACTSTLSITTSASVPAGNYPITVTARSEGLSRSTTFTLTVTALAPVAAPTLTPNGGNYSGSVSVAMQTATAGAAIYFSTDGSTPTPSSRAYTGAVTLTSSAVVKAKAYKSSNTPSAEASASFTISTISQPFNFTLSNSGNLTVQAGASAMDTISATLSSGSSQAVTLSASGLPAGTTASFATSSCSPNCATVVTLRTSGTTPTGSFPITITATGGGVTKTTAFSLTVATAPPPPPPLPGPVQLPALPKIIHFSYPAVTGRTIVVPAGGNLQQELNNAQRGDEIVLPAGVTFTGNFILPAKSGTSANGWVIIRSDKLNQLPSSGIRVSPAQASLMPKIVTPNVAPALKTAVSAEGWWIAGLEITVEPSLTAQQYGIVTLGEYGQTSLATVPKDLVLDRTYIHGQTNTNLSRCVALNSAFTMVQDSYLSECHGKGFDSQAIAGGSGPGPYKIVNNTLEGAGENIMFGGNDPKIANLIPSDIEIRGNYVHTPIAWKGIWTRKNLMETKNAQRLLIEGNIFDGSWGDGQVGYAFVFKSSNQSGGCIWCQTRDLTFRYNIVRNAAAGFNLAGKEGSNKHPLANLMANVLIEHNILENIGVPPYDNGDRRVWQFLANASNITIRSNTLSSYGALNLYISLPQGTAATNLDFRDNIGALGQYGIKASGGKGGEADLPLHIAGTVNYSGNVLIGSLKAGYPTSTFVPNLSAALGTSQGANQSAVLAATQYALNGGGTGIPPPPPPPPAPALDTTAPSVPAGLSATAVSASQMNLSWTASTDNVGVTGYKIYSNGTQVATVTGPAYQNTGLTANTTYSYTVAGFDAAGNISNKSGAVTRTTLPSTAPPSAPVVTLSANPTSISSGQSSTLSWSSTNATSCTASGGWTGSKTLSGTQGLSPTQNTTYTLSCAGGGGSSSASSNVSVTQPPTSGPISLPTLPQTFSVPMPNQTGQVISVAAGDATAFQQALNNAQYGDTIELQAGSTYTGSFSLPNKTGNGWIVVRGSTNASLPSQGIRVNPAQASLMPKLVSSGGNRPALYTANGAHHYRLVGLEITIPPTLKSINTIVSINYTTASYSDIPNNIVLDRVYVHGQPAVSLQRCVLGNGSYVAIVDSYLSECHGKGFDSQAFVAWSGPGPFKIVNNHLEGAGENVMFGGADPSVQGLIPSDAEIRGNYIYTPASWGAGLSSAQQPWTKKNLFETKNARRILVEGNILDGSWASAQTGSAMVLKSSNQSGSCTWCQASDLTIRYNLIRNTGGGINLSGSSGANNHPLGGLTSRVLIEHNVFENMNVAPYIGDARPQTFYNNVQDVTIRNNTYDTTGYIGSFIITGSAPSVTNLEYKDNIVPFGQYGISSSISEAAFAQATAGTFSYSGNVAYGTSQGANYSAKHPSLPLYSTYAAALANGKGANRPAVLAATQHAVNGGGTPPPPPAPALPPPPPTPAPTPTPTPTATPTPTPNPSCPGFVIEGFGRNTTGGCGGRTMYVTNLNDSGPGSFRDAVTQTGPRIVKFQVSGTVVLNSSVGITNDNLTIDGSDAPNGGIAIRGHSVGLRASNIIVRNIRFRVGPSPDSLPQAGDRDNLSIQGSGRVISNIVIDHSSFSWADDGNLDITERVRDVSVQWSILSENMGPGHMLLGAGGICGTDGATRVTVHHNLFVQGGRNPELTAGDVDWTNNVVFRDYDGRNHYGPSHPLYFSTLSYTGSWYAPFARVNWIGNYFKPGSREVVGSTHQPIRANGDSGGCGGVETVYVEGNIGPSRPNDSLPQRNILNDNSLGTANIVGTKIGFTNYTPVTTTSANQAYTDVLAGAGATLPCRDAVDNRIVGVVTNGTGVIIPWGGGEVDPTTVGGWPNLTLPC